MSVAYEDKPLTISYLVVSQHTQIDRCLILMERVFATLSKLLLLVLRKCTSTSTNNNNNNNSDNIEICGVF